MKLTKENANKIRVGDYVRIDYGGGVTIEGAVYAVDPTKGLWVDRPDGKQRVHGPYIFQKSLDIAWPKEGEHPKMIRDNKSQHFRVA